jgi:ribulose-phosphate 3-epimerase
LFSGNQNEELEYKMLDEEAEKVPPGSDGLVALETFQGSRTPVTDPLARGAIVGLTLSHGRSHIWRALLEAVCFGTRACVEGLAKAGHGCDEIVIAGGATRSPLWLQMHADVTGKPVVVCENADAPLLGCAILASVGAGIHPTAEAAVQAMVRTAKRIEPNPAVAETYSDLYNGVYSKLSSAVRPVVHSISQLRGGGSIETLDCSLSDTTPLGDKRVTPDLRVRGGGGAEPYQDVSAMAEEKGEQPYPIVSPSLLASDWSNIESEIERCVKAGLFHLHIDVFDGVFLDSPYALTFGPQMIEAMRRCSKRHTCKIVLDVHLCVYRPARYVEAMAKAGADRIIFQWEAMAKEANTNDDTADDTIGQLEQAVELAEAIREYGMLCGISINPQTGVEEILPLLESGLVDLVDILAVEPGFGGQSFQESALGKIQQLRRWIDAKGDESHQEVDIKLLVDGGINAETSPLVIEAGADILVAGTFLFKHPSSISDGAKELLSKK